MSHRSHPGQPAQKGRRPGRFAVAVGSGALLLAALIVWPGTSAQAAKYETIKSGFVAQISYAPNSYIIGNAYPGWTDVIQGPGQFASGPGNPNGASYRWGYLFGPRFDSCGWIEDGQATATSDTYNRCGSPQQIDTAHFRATYTNGTISPNAGDGNATTRTGDSGCDTGYGNVEPWRVPATPGNARSLAAGDSLLWRYISRDGNWVMVRDRVASAGNPNWFFVPRHCINLG